MVELTKQRSEWQRPIRVLHVFAPSLRSRFGGQNITWQYNFSHWNAHGVNHRVLDCGSAKLVDSREAFSFEYPVVQRGVKRWERAVWVGSLFSNLAKHRKQYDILHMHVLWWGGLAVGPWSRWMCIPAVYESILLDEDTPGGISRERLGGLKVRCLRDYRAILAISDYLAEDYSRFGFSRERVFTLMNSVDTVTFAPAETKDAKMALRRRLNLPLDATVLVFVGSVIWRKGADVLVRAFSQAATKYANLHLLIVGPKAKAENPSLDEDLVNDLRRFLGENNLSERVSFTGMVRGRQDLADIYRASDIFVFPSRNEGLGNVVLEAMSSGLPVIVTHLPVLEKVIQHGENGLLLPVDDVNALSGSILKLDADRSLAEELGHNARLYVEENHGFASWQARLVEFYRGLLC
jgi:glycosyltransferase involved in cell wall biosynthesis